MSSMWILVADAARARVFETKDKVADSALIQELAHDESRAKGAELASDRPGHDQTHGGGHGSYVAGSDPKDFEAERFAQQLAKLCIDGRNAGSFSQLLVVAPPRFHGLLKAALDKQTLEMVVDFIDKDYTQLAEKDLLETLSGSYRPSLA